MYVLPCIPIQVSPSRQGRWSIDSHRLGFSRVFSGFREFSQFFDPHRILYWLPVTERCERFTYQTPKTLIGARLPTGAVELDCYRSAHGAAFFHRGGNESHQAVVRHESRAAVAGRIIPFPFWTSAAKTDRSVARCRCSHESAVAPNRPARFLVILDVRQVRSPVMRCRLMSTPVLSASFAVAWRSLRCRPASRLQGRRPPTSPRYRWSAHQLVH